MNSRSTYNHTFDTRYLGNAHGKNPKRKLVQKIFY